MGEDTKFDWRLVIGSLSAVSVLTTFVAYAAIQLNGVDNNTRSIEKQSIRTDAIQAHLYSIEQSTIQNKMQNTHIKDTIGLFHNFGDSNE